MTIDDRLEESRKENVKDAQREQAATNTDLVRRMMAEHPEWKADEIARETGITPTNVRVYMYRIEKEGKTKPAKKRAVMTREEVNAEIGKSNGDTYAARVEQTMTDVETLKNRMQSAEEELVNSGYKISELARMIKDMDDRVSELIKRVLDLEEHADDKVQTEYRCTVERMLLKRLIEEVGE